MAIIDIFHVKQVVECKCEKSFIKITDSKNAIYFIEEMEVEKVLKKLHEYLIIKPKNNKNYLEIIDFKNGE